MRSRPPPAPPLLPALLLLAVAVSAGPAPERDPALEARRERRQRLAQAIGESYALVLGQPLTDVLQPRQEGHLLYLVAMEEPDGALLLAGAKSAGLRDAGASAGNPPAPVLREMLILRETNPRFAQFHAARLVPGTPSEEALGVASAVASAAGGTALAQRVAAALPPDARLLLPSYAGADHAPVREVRRTFVEALAASRPDVKIDDLHPTMTALRAVKDAVEIAALERAVELTLAAFREALPSIRPTGTEADVDGRLLAAVRSGGGRPAYPFVVAGGGNSVYPHYFRNDAPLAAGDLLLIDAGASIQRYAADVTRTFPVSGRFSPRQREIYEIVLRAQRAAIEAVKPGADFGTVDAAARRIIVAAGYGAHFLHGTSHHVGLDVHDPGPRELAAGMTITVEPGIYLLDEGIGVRIEDVVLVTAGGCRVLSEGFPKDADAIEELLLAARAPRSGDAPEAQAPKAEESTGK